MASMVAPRKVALGFCTAVLSLFVLWILYQPDYIRGKMGTGQVPTGAVASEGEENMNAVALGASLGVPLGQMPACGNATHAATREVWLEADARYSHLLDDKFTIAMLTYKRPVELNQTLTAILKDKTPSLHEVVIIWNEIDVAPPANFVSKHGVPVRYRVSERNSLTQRFIPDPDYKTKAIVIQDDDVYYKPDDLEFVFQTWRQGGRYRVTGALPRCYNVDENSGKMKYGGCKKGSDWYSLVLTNLAIVHISFMDYFSSSEAIPSAIRAHIDDNFNCEDIAMNYIASMLTCAGPQHVVGNEKYASLNPKTGISHTPSHQRLRSECLQVFTDIIGFFPLVHQMGSIHRGMPFYP